MILNNEFVVEAPVERAWALLDEVESVISCMPGAAYVGREGDDYKVSIKVKVGAISANFQGTVQFLEKNEAARTAKIRGAGKDLGGKASASATINVKFESVTGARTKVLVETDLAMTGRLAQFGGGVIADIASRLIEQFTQNLHAAVLAQAAASTPDAAAPTAGTPDTSSIPQQEPAELNLGPVIAASALRAVRRAVVPVLFFLMGWIFGKFF